MPPITVMTGLPADNPLDTIFYNPESMTISSVEINTDQILEALDIDCNLVSIICIKTYYRLLRKSDSLIATADLVIVRLQILD
jgi:hypothetical protein